MSRHPLDNGHTGNESSRAEQYARIEREGQASDASKTLQRRPQDVSGETRMKEFVEIEKRGDS